MAGYMDRLALKGDALDELFRREDSAYRKKHYIEAVCIQMVRIELFLRAWIKERVGNKDYLKKAWNGEAHFSELIERFALLNGPEKTVQKLRAYNKKRNSVVHHTLEYSSFASLEKDAKTAYDMGNLTGDMLVDNIAALVGLTA